MIQNKLRVATAALLMAPMAAQAQGMEVAMIELKLGSYDLSYYEDNDGDFDASGVLTISGQALFRRGSVMLEIQGMTTDSVDDGDDDENSTSFGSFGHYIFPILAGEGGVVTGLMGGTNVEENDGQGYALIGLNYGADGWHAGLGHSSLLYGQDGDDTLQSWTYMTGGYGFDLPGGIRLDLSGYVGQGKTDDDDEPVTLYEVNLDLGYEVASGVQLSAGVSLFELRARGGGSSDGANGAEYSLGLTMALGRNAANAKEATRFDVPNFHREITWADELSL